MLVSQLVSQLETIYTGYLSVEDAQRLEERKLIGLHYLDTKY